MPDVEWIMENCYMMRDNGVWGNAIKYMLRFQKKNGLEDLKKARKNLDWLIEEMEHEE